MSIERLKAGIGFSGVKFSSEGRAGSAHNHHRGDGGRIKPLPEREPIQRVPPEPIKRPPLSIQPVNPPIRQIKVDPPTLVGPPIKAPVEGETPTPRPSTGGDVFLGPPVQAPVEDPQPKPGGDIFLGPPIRAPQEGEGVSAEPSPDTTPIDRTPIDIVA